MVIAFEDAHLGAYRYIYVETVLTPAQTEWSYADILRRMDYPEESYTAELRKLVELRTSTTGEEDFSQLSEMLTTFYD